MTTTVRYFDHYVFKWCASQLDGKSPDDIVAFYVSKFVFKNAAYLTEITSLYHLPNDFLKLHQKVVTLSDAPFGSEASPPKVENACPYDVVAYCDIPCTCEECAASESEWIERWQRLERTGENNKHS